MNNDARTQGVESTPTRGKYVPPALRRAQAPPSAAAPAPPRQQNSRWADDDVRGAAPARNESPRWDNRDRDPAAREVRGGFGRGGGRGGAGGSFFDRDGGRPSKWSGEFGTITII